MRRDLVSPSPTLDDASHIVGPLLIAIAFMWALWGLLSLQLYQFVIAAARERLRGNPKSWSTDLLLLSSPFPSLQPPPKKNEDVNPWTLDVIDRATPPPPLSINTQTHRSHAQNANRHYDLRLSDISYDPYAYHSSTVTSPITTDETHGDRERRHFNSVPNGDISRFPTHSPSALQNAPKKLSTIFSTASPRAQSIANSTCPQASISAYSLIFTVFMLRSTFVRSIVLFLYVVVTVQVAVGTAYVWQVLVHGWSASGKPGGVFSGDARLLAVSSHILGAIAFLFSMVFFAYRILLLPGLVALKANKASNGSEVFGVGSGKGGKLLRPLSLVLKRNDSDTMRHRNSVGNGGPALGGLYAGGGHVQPIPSLWQKLRVKRITAFGKFRSWSNGWFSSVRRDMAIGMKMGFRDRVYAVLGLLFVTVAILLVILVSVCGIVVGAQAINDPDSLGTEMSLTGENAIWRAGELVLNVGVSIALLTSLLRTRKLTHPYASLVVAVFRFIGESGIALVLVALVALVLVSTMTDGHNTISCVPGLMLPALYANTVLLNVNQSFAFFAHISASTRSDGSPSTDGSYHRRSGTALGSAKDKDGKDGFRAGDIEMGLRGISSSNSLGQQQVVRLSRAENSETSSRSNASAGAGITRAGGSTGKEKDASPSQAAAAMHMERDTLGETSTGLKHATSTKSLRHDFVPPTVTPGGVKPYNPSKRLSGVSQDGLSLDLPVFRKGRRQYYNDYYNGAWDGYDDDDEDEEDNESYLSSEEGGTWDYGYASNVVNAERDRERDERERATLAAAATVADAPNNIAPAANAGQAVVNETLDISSKAQQHHNSLQVPYQTSPLHLHRKSFPSSPLAPPRRRSTLKHYRSEEGVLDELSSDAKSMHSVTSRTSRTSRRSRSRHSRPFSSALHLGPNYRHPLHTHHYSHLYDQPIPSSASSFTATPPPAETLSPPQQRRARRLPPTPNDNNVLVISPDREPSIAELSLFKAASVAATRASTGSQWSSYTYPKPMAFPELDEDLQQGSDGFRYREEEEEVGVSGGGSSSGLNGGLTLSSSDGLGTGTGLTSTTGAGLDEEDEGEFDEGDGMGEMDGGISFAEYDPDATESMRGDGSSLMEQDIGDALYSFGHTTRLRDASGGGVVGASKARQTMSSFHPYASGALDADEPVADGRARRVRNEDPGRRRWRVHPLMRMVEKGRLKR